MKKVLLTLAVVGVAASVLAQGTVQFNNRLTGTLVTYVYSGGSTQVSGAGTADTPAGTFNWSAYTRIGGSTYSAQLFAANGQGAAESSLAGANPISTFRTGAAAGNVAVATATLTGVPADAAFATIQMRAWDNKGGLYPTWAEAEIAWNKGLIAAGKSPIFNLAAIGGNNPAPSLTGLQSFNIYFVPEPSTMALAGLGAAAMMIFRRRK